MTYEEIKENYDKAVKAWSDFKHEFDSKWDFDRSYYDYQKELFASKEYAEYNKWDALERLNRVPQFRIASKFDLGCRMTFADFMETIKDGYISDWDGSGCYGTEDEVSNIGVDIEQMLHGQYRTDFTHIYWYNK